MSTQAALPPHVPADTSTGFDADADVAALSATPKEAYQNPEPPPPPAGEPPPATGADAPAGDGPAPDAPQGDGPAGGDAKASAREFIEVYDILQSYGFSFYSQGMDPKQFSLPTYAKDRAVHHLAKGLEKMGTPELPWWVGLLIALTPPAGINFMVAKAHRAEQDKAQAEAARKNAKRQQQGEALHPDTIIHPNGQEVKVKSPPPPPSARAAYPKANAAPCIVCGTPTKGPGKKYCGKSCSGKGRAAAERAAKAARQAPTTTATTEPAPAQ